MPAVNGNMDSLERNQAMMVYESFFDYDGCSVARSALGDFSIARGRSGVFANHGR